MRMIHTYVNTHKHTHIQGNLRKMKFAFDLAKGEGEMEAEEIYYDFQAHIKKKCTR
jgi:hypothetical protein